MILKTKIVGLLILALLMGCNNKESNARLVMEDIAMEELEFKQKESNTVVDRKLIKEGTISFETDNIAATRKNIFESIKKNKAYIASDNANNYSYKVSNTIVVRVPSENFDKLLKQTTAGVTYFDEKNINVQDVTDQFLDMSVRIKTKKELEKRYLELLKKANNVSEILKVEEQIGKLRADIESIEGRLNYLNNQVSFSTLTISFYKTSLKKDNYSDKFSDGFKNGWSNLVLFIIDIVTIWPFILLTIAVIIIIQKIRKGRRK